MAKNTKTQTQAAAAESAEDKVLAEHPCACQFYSIERGDVPEGADPNEYLTYEDTGCTATTTRVFAPGHDAKLKSLLIKAGVEEASVRCEQGGVASIATADVFAARFDFGHMVLAGIARAGQRLGEKLDRQAARKESRAAARAAKVTKRERSKKNSVVKGHEALEAFHDGALAQARKDEGLTSEVTIKVGRWTYTATIDSASNEATFTSANGQTKTVPAGKYSIVTK